MEKNKKKMTKEQCALATDADVLNFVKKEAKIRGAKHPSIGEEEFYSIGLETVCLCSMKFVPKEMNSFIDYIKKCVPFEMNQRIRKDVYGVCQDKNEISHIDVVMIEELVLGKSEKEEDDISFDERLSALIRETGDDHRAKWEHLETLLNHLTAEEREIVLIRYGFFDNHGDAATEYMKKHKMKKTTFYNKAEAAVMKMRKFVINH